MSIGFGEWELSAPHQFDPVLSQRSDDIFVQLALGLIGIHYQADARRIATIFEDTTILPEQRNRAVAELRAMIIDFRATPILGMPPLGHVVDRALTLAAMEDQTAVPEIIDQYVEHYRLVDSPYGGRRTPAAVTEVA